MSLRLIYGDFNENHNGKQMRYKSKQNSDAGGIRKVLLFLKAILILIF
jgi:hypothetical protein